MSVDVSVWRADIERQMAEWLLAPCPVDTDGDGDCAACARRPGIHGHIPSPVYIVGEGVPPKLPHRRPDESACPYRPLGPYRVDDMGDLLVCEKCGWSGWLAPPAGWPSPNETEPINLDFGDFTALCKTTLRDDGKFVMEMRDIIFQ